MKRKIIIIGYDPEIIEMILNLDNTIVVGYVDMKKITNDKFDLKYLGTDEYFCSSFTNKNVGELIITIDDTSKRNHLFDLYEKHNFKFATIISKKCNISKYSNIGEGCIVQDLSNISFNVFLGKNIKINTGANVMHDVIIGDHSTLAPNAVILGYVKIGPCCFIGSNSTLLPNINIDANSILGAGCVATKSLGSGVYAGIPARRINE